MPRGSGSLQVFVVPSVVMTSVTVADPSYVMTSRRSFVVGVPPASVTVAFICRTTLPDVGYVGFPLTTGITNAVVVSPTRRVAVKTTPESVLPLVDSSPRATPLIVR